MSYGWRWPWVFPSYPQNNVLDMFNNILLEFLEKHKDTKELQVHSVQVAMNGNFLFLI